MKKLKPFSKGRREEESSSNEEIFITKKGLEFALEGGKRGKLELRGGDEETKGGLY